MVREIKQIETELEALNSQGSAIAQQLEAVTLEYVDVLGETLQQQLIFSVYQICTQEYPQAFLNLSLSEQQALQNKVRSLGQEAQNNLKIGKDILEKLPQNEEGESSETLANNVEIPNKNYQDNANSQTQIDQVIASSHLREEAMKMILENVSSQTNTTLQEMGILPQGFPKEMIEAALQSEGAGSMSDRAPGVLKLMLEVERTNKQQNTDREENEVMELALVRLRGAELEFAAPSLNVKRREIRKLVQQLKQLQEQCYKLLEERAIAQAEMAWRSSWLEE